MMPPTNEHVQESEVYPYRDPMPEHYRETMPTPVSSENPFTSMLREAAQQAATERSKIVEAAFTDDKVKDYFQKSINYLMATLDSDNYDFMLLHGNDAGVPKEGYSVFSQIFVKTCQEIGLEVKPNDQYANMKIQKLDFRAILNKLAPAKVDINEKVRAILHG